MPELKLNLKNKIIASSAGFAILFFALIYFIVLPTIADIKVMGKNIEEQRIDLEKKYLKGQSLKQLSENLKKIEPTLGLLDKIFINKNRDLEFITSLENQASQAQVSQKINLGASEPADNKKFQKNNLQLFAKGGFNQTLRYLLNLESLSYYINAKILELTPAGEGQLSLFLSADTYWKN